LRSSRARRGVAVAVGSPSMRRMCRGRGCGAWGHGRGLHARGVVPRSPSMRRVCRAVAGFAPGRLRWRVRRVGSPSLSSRAWSRRRRLRARGVAVAVFARAAWGRRRRCAACVAVAVFVRVVVAGAARRVAVAGCRRYAACVVVVAFALRVVSLSPFSRRVGCRRCLRCVRCGVAAAARGAATGRPGGTRRRGARSWEGRDGVGACPRRRCGW